MFTLRVINSYRVFDQDYLSGDTVVVPEADRAEQLLAFRFQYGAVHLAVFELVEETVSESAVLETGKKDTDEVDSPKTLKPKAKTQTAPKTRRKKAPQSVATESPATEATASLAFTENKNTDAIASDV